MFGLLRSLLICLLVLALPAQGVVAATMVFCHSHQAAAAGDTTGHHDGHADSESHAGTHVHAPSAAVHDHANHGEAATATATGTISSTVSATESTASDGARPAPADPHKCSACAVCCAATAPSSMVMEVAAASVAPSLFSTIVATVEPFAVGGPDRPPRRPIVQPA